MTIKDLRRFARLSFEDFRRMAQDSSLSPYEKIGFPDSYRRGKEKLIFSNIRNKLSLLNKKNKTVLEIGPGCSALPLKIIDLCRKQKHKLILIDSKEVLAHLPDKPFIEKCAAAYPRCDELLDRYRGRVDVILAYSMFHYVFAESNIWEFLDASLELLAHEGEMLIGDIPNVSKRKRFFSSPAGLKFHRKFTRTQGVPRMRFNQIERRYVDDAVLLGVVARARSQGFDAYLLPQSDDLPMANRREDLLIKRP
jgi:hypothetical protein